MYTAITNRRSIRKYKDTPVPHEMIEKILHAGILAPSSKNRQPWKFIVISGSAKKELEAVMRQGLAREKERPLLPDSRCYLSGAEYTVDIIAQAPVIIVVMNTLGMDLHGALTPEERIYELCNAQSIGAAIENMTLTAADMGLGSLWICDIYFAYEELSAWLNTEGTLFAAVALGYADEMPMSRPRKPFCEMVEWKSE